MRGSKTVYILPNLFTTASLFCGFYAILAAIDGSGRFTFAAVLIFVAVLVGGFAIGANLVATCGGRRGIFLKTAVRNDVLPHLCGECRGQEGEEPEK